MLINLNCRILRHWELNNESWRTTKRRQHPTFGGSWRGKSKIPSRCFCEVHNFSRGWQDGGALRSCGKVLVKHVPATYRASRNWRQHLDSTPWTGRRDKFHSDAWCLDVNSLSADVYPFVFDNARVNRRAVTSPNPTPLFKRSLNLRALYFCARTEQVAFNFHVQFTNKSVGSLWWSLKTTRHLIETWNSRWTTSRTTAKTATEKRSRLRRLKPEKQQKSWETALSYSFRVRTFKEAPNKNHT